MLKKAVIDIDNTLWHFCDILHERLREINHVFPSPESWVKWDFWEDFCSKEDFLKTIDSIHLDQNNEKHLPYPEARGFLQNLKDCDYHIVIASHRISESKEQTHKWLLKHKLVFDELHLSFNKAVLFDKSCHVVVDDAPHVLEQAKQRGVISAGLLFPWNRNYKNNGHRLFDNLEEVLRYVLENTGARH